MPWRSKMTDRDKTKVQLVDELAELRHRIVESEALEIERKQSEEEIKKRQEYLEAVLHAALDAIVTLDASHHILEWNPGAEQIFGYSRDEAVGRNLDDLVSRPDVVDEAKAITKKVLSGQHLVPLETVRYRKDGTPVNVILASSPIQIEGELHGAVGVYTDITDRKRAEEALREGEEKFRLTFESVPDAVTISGIEDGRYLSVNNGFCRITGYSKEEAIGKTAFELGLYVNPADRERLLANLQDKGMVDGFEVQYRMKDERVLDTLLSGKIFRYEKKDCLVAVVKDVTQFKGTQEELRRSEKRYRDLFNSVSDLIYTQDLEGHFLSANRAMTEIFGYELEEFIGHKTTDFMKPELRPLFYTEYIERIKKQGHNEGVTSYFGRDGRKIYLEYRSRLIKPGIGEPYITGIARDVTERILAEKEIKKLNKQMLQAQKMEAVGTLAGGIAHDFNNLLQGILGFTQMLLMEKNGNDPDTAKLKQIEKAAHRASELTQQLLAFSRKVESNLRPVDLNQELEQVRNLLERTIPKMIAIELHLEDHLNVIRADPAQLEQVIMNLGVNARDAMPDSGKLVFETENVTLDQEYCKAHLGARPGRYVLLSISDTGQGMDRETLEHIFEPFFTTKGVGSGTGLGLAMVYGIIKGHGGYIMCYSEPGEGTTFKIYLPVMEGDPARNETEPNRNAAVPEGGSETILLVDDEEILRDIGKDILEKFGYTVLLAADGESALELYRENPGDISLVILDIVMPGMGGKECLEEILKVNPQAKVVMASGYSINGRVKEVLDGGARAFIKKPYELKRMLGEVRKVLDG
jgi:two-component system, cell cycle sensor histidine kinase and response regulator CckA